ncbi:LysR family transcriptional regulator [Agarivorans sp. MS3-6]
MNLQAIEAFVLSHQLGSISAAAKHMQKNRAQLSQWITNLEIDWNVELFTRDGHKPVLSEQGLKMLPLCEQLLASKSHLKKQVEQIANQTCFRINLGVSAFLQDELIAKIISKFNHRYPDVNLQIYQRRDEQLLNWQQQPQLDLAMCFYRDAYPSHYTVEDLGKMPVIAVCATNHPLAQQQKVTINQVMKHTWITLLTTANTKVWDLENIQKRIEVEHHSLAIDLCLQGVGIFVGQQIQLDSHIQSGELKIIDHHEAIANESLGLIYPKLPMPNSTVQALIDICKTEVVLS